MKKLLIITSIIAAPLCFAKPGDGEKKGQRQPPQFIIDKFDADGDGQLNETERAAAKAHRDERKKEMREFRKSFDLDGDGKLNETEKAAFEEGLKAKIVEHFDEDGDGVLNAQEQANADEAKERRGKKGKKGKEGKKGKKQAE